MKALPPGFTQSVGLECPDFLHGFHQQGLFFYPGDCPLLGAGLDSRQHDQGQGDIAKGQD